MNAEIAQVSKNLRFSFVHDGSLSVFCYGWRCFVGQEHRLSAACGRRPNEKSGTKTRATKRKPLRCFPCCTCCSPAARRPELSASFIFSVAIRNFGQSASASLPWVSAPCYVMPVKLDRKLNGRPLRVRMPILLRGIRSALCPSPYERSSRVSFRNRRKKEALERSRINAETSIYPE